MAILDVLLKFFQSKSMVVTPLDIEVLITVDSEVDDVIERELVITGILFPITIPLENHIIFLSLLKKHGHSVLLTPTPFITILLTCVNGLEPSVVV